MGSASHRQDGFLKIGDDIAITRESKAPRNFGTFFIPARAQTNSRLLYGKIPVPVAAFDDQIECTVRVDHDPPCSGSLRRRRCRQRGRVAIKTESLTAAAFRRFQSPREAIVRRVGLQTDSVFEQIENRADAGPADEIALGRLARLEFIRGVILPNGAGFSNTRPIFVKWLMAISRARSGWP